MNPIAEENKTIKFAIRLTSCSDFFYFNLNIAHD